MEYAMTTIACFVIFAIAVIIHDKVVDIRERKCQIKVRAKNHDT